MLRTVRLVAAVLAAHRAAEPAAAQTPVQTPVQTTEQAVRRRRYDTCRRFLGLYPEMPSPTQGRR